MKCRVRNNGIDAIKLLAAMAVVCLHVGHYDGLSEVYGEMVRLLSRWAVPYFFLVSGFFIGIEKTHDDLVSYCVSKLSKVSIACLAASVLMLPLALIKMGPLGCISYWTSPEFLLRGGYFHLWFLSSMLLGYLGVLVLVKIGCSLLMLPLASMILLLYPLMDGYNPVSQNGVVLFQHFSGFAFIVLGMNLRRISISLSQALMLLFAGIVLSVVEVAIVVKIVGNDPFDVRFLYGTILLALGVFGLAKGISLPAMFARLGRDSALLIYLLHPYFILVSDSVLQRFLDGAAYKPILVLCSFILSLAFGLFARRYFPSVVVVLDGDSRFLCTLNRLVEKFSLGRG